MANSTSWISTRRLEGWSEANCRAILTRHVTPTETGCVVCLEVDYDPPLRQLVANWWPQNQSSDPHLRALCSAQILPVPMNYFGVTLTMTNTITGWDRQRAFVGEKRRGPFQSVRASMNGTTLHSEIESTVRSGLRTFQLVDDTIGVDKVVQTAMWVTACGDVSMLGGGPGSPTAKFTTLQRTVKRPLRMGRHDDR